MFRVGALASAIFVVGLAAGDAVFAAAVVQEKLTTQDMAAQAAKDVESVKGILDMALKRLEEARGEKDMVKINCVNDQLSKIKGVLKIAETALTGFKEAVARGDQELIDHEFTKISIAASKAENLRSEVEGCIGELSQYTGETVLESTIEGDIRQDNPAENDVVAFTPIDTERPDRSSGDR